MQINAVVHQPAAAGYSADPQLPAGWHADWSTGYPPLSDRDVAMLTAVTGVTFNWPPQKDEHFPQAAADLAMAHLRAWQQTSKWSEFTSADLSELHRQGVLNDELFGKALDYLKSHPNLGSDEGSTGSSRSHLQPGTVASDGSVYL